MRLQKKNEYRSKGLFTKMVVRKRGCNFPDGLQLHAEDLGQG